MSSECECAGRRHAHIGRRWWMQVVVTGPRFSGLQGESLSTAVRWEQDVVRLERANLQQKNSR